MISNITNEYVIDSHQNKNHECGPINVNYKYICSY